MTKPRTVFTVVLGFFALQGLVLWWFGQPSICACGYVKWWEGVVLSPGNSQHLTDWYTFSHLIHGFLFYWLLTLVAPRLSVSRRFVIALGVEVGWELLENTPMIIEHYRQQALAVGYTGDSILNSLADTLAMVAGFALAARLPVWGSVAMVLGLEALPLWIIRDGLSLNILNLLHRFDFISRWQSGG